MKQSFARIFVLISLSLSVISFILSLLAIYSPNWKYIQLRPTFTPSLQLDDHPMDPLIRGEVEKYIDILYRRGETHSFGLLTHCLVGGECGENSLPFFEEKNYGLCHNLHYHRQCIFSNILLTTTDVKCTCQQPSYVQIIHKLLILLIILELLFFFVNILRLIRQQCNTYCLNDSPLRLISLITSLVSILFLIIILIQYNGNRLREPIDFFESMRQHYSRIQIYTFSKDLELIIQQIEHALDVTNGASYICILIVLILIVISFLTSIIVEIKITSARSSLTLNDEDEKRHIPHENPNNHMLIQSNSLERFVPSDQIRFTRQTKV